MRKTKPLALSKARFELAPSEEERHLKPPPWTARPSRLWSGLVSREDILSVFIRKSRDSFTFLPLFDSRSSVSDLAVFDICMRCPSILYTISAYVVRICRACALDGQRTPNMPYRQRLTCLRWTALFGELVPD